MSKSQSTRLAVKFPLGVLIDVNTKSTWQLNNYNLHAGCGGYRLQRHKQGGDMTMKQLWIVLFFLFVSTVSGAESWQEPEDFRGLKWGASVEEMRKIFPARGQGSTGGEVIVLDVDKPRIFSDRIKSFHASG